MYDAVVFDNDGVLTERTDRDVLRSAVRATFESFDVDPGEDLLDDFVAGVSPSRVEATCARLGLDVDAFWRERDAQFADHQCREADRGRKPAYDDVTVLDDLDVPLGVVSNNQNATIDHVFEVHDLHRHFGTWYGREPTMESVRRKKPEPYYLERALADLGAETALYVGDKATDVEAARAAGVDSVLVRREHNRAVTPEPTPTFDVDSLHAIPSLLAEY
ncbi:HAD-IA family hydrolase [Halorubellus sp. PRR65]|uniref:HAD family hydrolase n=1 Tax=Halorubellus sp. PRR65 TaxID=3098148 RepID=UPI002B2570C9|nr:HAD-IA family hydrolase [Halorubellus sp. PRR65]